jgi:CBS domain-containing protein
VSRQVAPSLIASTVAELRHYVPFDAMELLALEYLAAHLSLAYFAKGQTLLAPEDGVAKHMLIVQAGLIDGVEHHVKANAAPALTLTLTEGECFPIGALISQRASVLRFVAAQDSFCYQLPLADFEHVMDTSHAFRDFATRVSDAHSLNSPLKSIIRRAPVTVTPETKIRVVLAHMKALRIGPVAVVSRDAAAQPIGIFTERDVLDRIALAGNGAVPVSSCAGDGRGQAVILTNLASRE